MAQLLMPGSVVAMTDQAADRLLKLDSGDAALLYLHLLRRGSPEGLRWPEERKRAALKQLQDQGLASLSLTAAPAGNVLVNTTGNSGLAKGGSGDVLTGIVAALLAQGATAVRAAAVGVWLHGRAGDLAAERLTPYGMTPEDVVSSLPAAIGEIL